MVAFAVCIVSFPALMSQWPSVGLQMPLVEQINIILGFAPRVDALSGATPLDALKTALKLGDGSVDVAHLLANQDVFGNFAGRGWEWVAGGYLIGGLYLWERKLITWHVPTAFLASMTLISGALWLYSPAQFANPLAERRRRFAQINGYVIHLTRRAAHQFALRLFDLIVQPAQHAALRFAVVVLHEIDVDA